MFSEPDGRTGLRLRRGRSGWTWPGARIRLIERQRIAGGRASRRGRDELSADPILSVDARRDDLERLGLLECDGVRRQCAWRIISGLCARVGIWHGREPG